MRRLIWVLVLRTIRKVYFLTLRLKYASDNYYVSKNTIFHIKAKTKTNQKWKKGNVQIRKLHCLLHHIDQRKPASSVHHVYLKVMWPSASCGDDASLPSQTPDRNGGHNMPGFSRSKTWTTSNYTDLPQIINISHHSICGIFVVKLTFSQQTLMSAYASSWSLNFEKKRQQQQQQQHP